MCDDFGSVFFDSERKHAPGKHLGVGFVDSVELTFLDFVNVHLVVFDNYNQYLIITLLIYQAIITVTVTDSGNCN